MAAYSQPFDSDIFLLVASYKMILSPHHLMVRITISFPTDRKIDNQHVELTVSLQCMQLDLKEI